MTATAATLTFEQFQQAMCDYAKSLEGIEYPGDEYYKQPEGTWQGYFEDGVTPEDAVMEDMTYWAG